MSLGRTGRKTWHRFNDAIRIRWVAAYTRLLEAKLLPDGFGWERYLEGELRRKSGADPLTDPTIAFWRLLILTNILIGAGLLVFAS